MAAGSSAPRLYRRAACSYIESRKRALRFLPPSFAAYIARSALRSSSSASALPGRAIAMPTLIRVPRAVRALVAQGAGDALGDLLGLRLAGDVLEQDAELVTAEPRRRVVRAQAPLAAGSPPRPVAGRRPRARACRSPT